MKYKEKMSRNFSSIVYWKRV